MALSPRAYKDAVYEQLARLGKAMAAPKRVELLDLLSQGPRTVERLAELAATSIANASQHLQVLRGARLVESEKRGLFVEYRLADNSVAELLVATRALGAARLAEIEQVTRSYQESRGALEAVDAEELLRRVRRGEVALVDVRPTEEYQAAHLPGALSIPLAELERRLGELPRGREVVAYCRGPWCVMAMDAVGLLRARGLAAHRLPLGVADWSARGGRVERPRRAPAAASRGPRPRFARQAAETKQTQRASRAPKES